MFKENYIIKGKIVCKTGLHIGGANESIEIGGIDNIIIRDSISDLPYIPGSSLKGKMRSLMEIYDKETSQNIISKGGDACKCGKCLICQVFGSSADSTDSQRGPTRIIVRDSFIDDETIEEWKKHEDVIRGAEIKYENTINRINSNANPRPSERVPKGSKFNFEIVFSIFDDDEYNLPAIFNAMKLVEDNYLGGYGSRGYGQVTFEDISISKRDADYYKNSSNEDTIVDKLSLDEVIEKISE